MSYLRVLGRRGRRGVRGKPVARRLRIETLEVRALLSVGATEELLWTSGFGPSAEEQELFESINRMRMDPQGELDILDV